MHAPFYFGLVITCHFRLFSGQLPLLSLLSITGRAPRAFFDARPTGLIAFALANCRPLSLDELTGRLSRFHSPFQFRFLGFLSLSTSNFQSRQAASRNVPPRTVNPFREVISPLVDSLIPLGGIGSPCLPLAYRVASYYAWLLFKYL